MNTKQQNRAIVLLAVGAGLIGGVVLGQLSIAGAPVGIQQTPQTAEVVRAEKFELLGQTGMRRAALELEPNGEPAAETKVRANDNKNRHTARLLRTFTYSDF